jgi:hypothetical protein
MNKHTPGPWLVGPAFDNDGQPEIIIEHQTPAGNLVVAVALGGLQGQEENARLIAAAPDLVEALRSMLSLVRRNAPELSGKVLGDAEAALTKAGAELFNTGNERAEGSAP